MNRIVSRPCRLGAALAVALLLLSSCTTTPPVTSGEVSEQTLNAVRAATEKYKDVNVALADGYLRDTMDACETPYNMGLPGNLGVMGVHYLRGDLLGTEEHNTRVEVAGTHTDFLRPAVLLYEPQADGSLQLMALENLVSAEAWAAAGHKQPPSFEGMELQYRADDPSQNIKAQYDLHMWLFRENPSGMFAPYNPNATCEHHVFNMPMYHPPADPNPPDDHSKH